jgi:hypothetical protein
MQGLECVSKDRTVQFRVDFSAFPVFSGLPTAIPGKPIRDAALQIGIDNP